MPIRILSAVAAVWACVASGQVHAAVLVCQPPVSSGLQVAGSEQEARALAISGWITEASRYGRAYTAWRLAAGKFYTCSKTASGAFQCVAKGEPCAISQVPPPPGSLAPRKPQGIEG